VEHASEILEVLAPLACALGGELAARLGQSAGAAEGDLPVGTTRMADPDYRRLLDELGHEPATMDELVRRTGLSAATLSSMLLMLELDARIERLPGNCYQILPEVPGSG
jgi:DNA processing protein